MDFDPYNRWLDLPAGPRPPNHYQLLGLSPDVADEQAVMEASRLQMARIKPYEDHPDPQTRAVVHEIMNRIGWARAVLRDPAKRAQYDERLARAGRPDESSSAPEA